MPKNKTWQDLLPDATACVQEWHTRPPTNVEMYLFNQKSKESPKMKISDLYESKYLSAKDLNGRQVKVVIQQVTFEEFDDKGIIKVKPVVHFVGKEKAMVCNITNSTTLAEGISDETDEWVGKEVVLFSEKVMFNGKPTEGLRIRVPPVEAAVADEEIPF